MQGNILQKKKPKRKKKKKITFRCCTTSTCVIGSLMRCACRHVATTSTFAAHVLANTRHFKLVVTHRWIWPFFRKRRQWLVAMRLLAKNVRKRAKRPLCACSVLTTIHWHRLFALEQALGVRGKRWRAIAQQQHAQQPRTISDVVRLVVFGKRQNIVEQLAHVVRSSGKQFRAES